MPSRESQPTRVWRVLCGTGLKANFADDDETDDDRDDDDDDAASTVSLPLNKLLPRTREHGRCRQEIHKNDNAKHTGVDVTKPSVGAIVDIDDDDNDDDDDDDDDDDGVGRRQILQ